MNKLIVVFAIALGLYVAVAQRGGFSPAGSDQTLASAFEGHKSGIVTEGLGTVVRLLPDDREGGRHQRFILRLSSGQTLLVAHNIDISRRLAGLKPGDTVGFKGEYEWNSEGGVIHWTHHDPGGIHPAGWLRHGGGTYQ